MRAFFAVLGLSVMVFGCGGDDGGQGPIIDELLPAAAAPGATIEVIGDRFCGDLSEDANADGTCVDNVAALVNFGEDQAVIRASVQSYTHTRISVAVPDQAPAGATVVVVLRGGVPSNSAAFDVQ